MTHKPFNCSNKAAGYENKDTGVDSSYVTHSRKQMPRIDGETLSEVVEKAKTAFAIYEGEDVREDMAWLEIKHGEDTEIIHQLKTQLQAEKERGDNIAYELVTVRRAYQNENAKVINLQAELRKQDDLLLESVKVKDYLYQTMELAIKERQNYLRECGELDE